MFALTPEQLALQARAREVAQSDVKARAAEVDRTEQYPWDNVERLKAGGFVGMTIPIEYGGQGLGWLDAVLVTEERAEEPGVGNEGYRRVCPRGVPCPSKKNKNTNNAILQII